MLMNVDGGGRAAHALRFGGHAGDACYPRFADYWVTKRIPCSGTGDTIVGDRDRCARYLVGAPGSKVDSGKDALSCGIAGGGAEILCLSDFQGDSAAGAQGHGLDAAVGEIAGAFSDTTGEGGKRDNSQDKKEAGTATIHEPSSRPFPRRERVVWRKTVSVEAHREFEQAHGPVQWTTCVVFKANAVPSSEMQPRVVDD